MRIDCHLHVNWLGYDAERAVAYLDSLEMDRGWALTWEMTDGLQVGYIHLSREQMWAACRRFPKRLMPFYAPDPRRPDAEKLLREDIKRGLKGFGECKVRLNVDHPDLLRLYRVAGEEGLPALLHLGKAMPPDFHHWYLHDIEGLGHALDLLPRVNFIAHGPGFWRYVSGDEESASEHYPQGMVVPGGKAIRLLQRHKNLYCDLSGESGFNALSRDPVWAKRFCARFAGRLLYGTDTYDRRLLELLEAMRLSAESMKLILGETARRLTPS